MRWREGRVRWREGRGAQSGWWRDGGGPLVLPAAPEAGSTHRTMRTTRPHRPYAAMPRQTRPHTRGTPPCGCGSPTGAQPLQSKQQTKWSVASARKRPNWLTGHGGVGGGGWDGRLDSIPHRHRRLRTSNGVIRKQVTTVARAPASNTSGTRISITPVGPANSNNIRLASSYPTSNGEGGDGRRERGFGSRAAPPGVPAKGSGRGRHRRACRRKVRVAGGTGIDGDPIHKVAAPGGLGPLE